MHLLFCDFLVIFVDNFSHYCYVLSTTVCISFFSVFCIGNTDLIFSILSFTYPDFTAPSAPQLVEDDLKGEPSCIFIFHPIHSTLRISTQCCILFIFYFLKFSYFFRLYLLIFVLQDLIFEIKIPMT